MGYYEPHSHPNPYPYPYRPYVGRREPSIFDGFSLRPLPYPVLLILIVISIFIGIKLFSSYEEAEEETESYFRWLLLALPLVLIFLVRWLSSFHGPSIFDRRRWGPGGLSGTGLRASPIPGPCQGGSPAPWGAAALIVLLLVLVHCQSS